MISSYCLSHPSGCLSFQDHLRLTSLGYKAQIQILRKDLNGAAESLERLEEHYNKQFLVPPIYALPYLVARFSFDIELLEDSLRSSNKPDFAKYRQHARKSCKNVLKNSKKYAPSRSAVFRLTGTFYWLINKQNKAVKYWQQAISEGERVGARPDLARTYMEIGKRFLENKSQHKKLNGIRVEAYLQKAREMFQAMDLQWDLDALEKIEQQ